MAVPLYMDVHVPLAITEQLRLRGVDVLTVIEDGRRRRPDDEVLERARELGRVVFTHDIGFRAMAEDWQRTGRPFAGLIFGRQYGVGIGRYVEDLELVALASDPAEFQNRILHLPL